MNGPHVPLEDLIKESLAEEASQVIPPPADQMWMKITARPGGKQDSAWPAPKKRRWFTPRVAVISLLLLVMAITTFTTIPRANAFSRRFFAVVVDLLVGGDSTPYGTVNIVRSNLTPPPLDAPPPPPDWPLATGERVVTVDEARAAAAFAFKQPGYMPKGMAPDIITVVSPERINQYFRSPNSKLIIRQQYLPGDFASNSFFNNARVKQVTIAGTEGTLVVQRNPYTGRDQVVIVWFDSDIDFRLEGDMSEKEALKVANSLK